MGAIPTLVSPAEYLETAFPDGDHEYVDGQVVERTMGERDHGTTQGEVFFFFRSRLDKWLLRPVVEQRIRLNADRYRVPDVVVVRGDLPDEQVFTTPPLLVIEIVSRTDSVHDLNQKIADYRAFGVPNIWIIDPHNRSAMHYTPDGVQEARDGYLRLPEADVAMPLEDVLPKRK